MIKFISPEPNGGMPFEIEDLLQLQDGLYQGLSFLCNAAATPFILSGCDVVTSTPTTCTISAGWVWLEGDFRYFPGYTGSYPFFIVKDNSKFYTKTFENGTVQNALVDAFAKPVTSVTKGQENIPMKPDNRLLHFKPAITSDVAAGLATEITDRTNADAYLQTEIDAINQILPTKATKLFTAIPWTDMAINSAQLSANSLVTQKPQYMLDELGNVRLRGVLNQISAIDAQDVVLAQLPNTVVPRFDLRLTVNSQYLTGYYVGANASFVAYNNSQTTKRNAGDLFIGGTGNFTGTPTGQLRFFSELPVNGSLQVSLDGVSWNISV